MGSLVHVAACPDYDRQRLTERVRECLQATAPADLIRPGTRVLLKPNIINDQPPDRAVCTHPEIVRAVAEWALERGGEVSIGDQPGYALTEEANGAFSNTGMIEACEGLDVRFRLLSRGGYAEIAPERTFRLKTIEFARDALRADVIINLPKAKTHGQTVYTGAIKNMFGAISPRQRIDVHLVGKFWALSEAIVDCYAARPPQLHLIDAVTVMEGMGPTQGNPRHLGALLASTDGVALDRVTQQLMGIAPGEVATTIAAHNLGLGENDLSQIQVTGAALADLTIKVEQSPVMRAEHLGPLLPLLRYVVSARPKIVRKDCRACGACKGICPAGAVVIEDYAIIDTHKCVECFCCQEACPFDAIQVQRPPAYRALWRLKRALDGLMRRKK